MNANFFAWGFGVLSATLLVLLIRAIWVGSNRLEKRENAMKDFSLQLLSVTEYLINLGPKLKKSSRSMYNQLVQETHLSYLDGLRQPGETIEFMNGLGAQLKIKQADLESGKARAFDTQPRINLLESAVTYLYDLARISERLEKAEADKQKAESELEKFSSDYESWKQELSDRPGEQESAARICEVIDTDLKAIVELRNELAWSLVSVKIGFLASQLQSFREFHSRLYPVLAPKEEEVNA